MYISHTGYTIHLFSQRPQWFTSKCNQSECSVQWQEGRRRRRNRRKRQVVTSEQGSVRVTCSEMPEHLNWSVAEFHGSTGSLQARSIQCIKHLLLVCTMEMGKHFPPTKSHQSAVTFKATCVFHLLHSSAFKKRWSKMNNTWGSKWVSKNSDCIIKDNERE